jgi:hypothetical protein
MSTLIFSLKKILGFHIHIQNTDVFPTVVIYALLLLTIELIGKKTK